MNVRLRPTRIEDLEFVVGAETHPDNREFVSQWSREAHEAALFDRDKKHSIVENIYTVLPVGYVILEDINSPHQSICLKRIVIADKGKGYGRNALRLVKTLAFETPNVHRLWLDVKDYNLRAKSLYESEGFVVEGLLRDCCRFKGQFESYYILSILKHEYRGDFNSMDEEKSS